MAETNKPSQDAVVSNFKVGGDSSGKGFLSHHYLIAVAGILLLLVLIVGLFTRHIWTPVAFSIDSRHYSKKQLNVIVASGAKHHLSREDTITQYIENQKRQIAAARLGVTIAPEDVTPVANTLFQKTADKLDIWEKIQANDIALQNDISYAQRGSYQGYVYYFPFDRLMATTLPDTNTEGYGDSTKIAANKQYAFDQANLGLKQRFANKISPTDLLKKIRKDPQLESVGTLNPSIAFHVNGGGSQLIGGEGASFEMEKYLVPFITSSTKPRFSPVTVTQKEFQLSNAAAPEYAGGVDAMYYFIEVQKVDKGHPHFNSDFASALKSMKVHRNV